ncbi:unnamed protein product, partial [Citrullus colocynthis]
SFARLRVCPPISLYQSYFAQPSSDSTTQISEVFRLSSATGRPFIVKGVSQLSAAICNYTMLVSVVFVGFFLVSPESQLLVSFP